MLHIERRTEDPFKVPPYVAEPLGSLLIEIG